MLMWFREEQVLDVIWAGAPWTKRDLGSDRMFRSRDDFKPTAGQLSGASRPWLDAEVVIASKFCEALGAMWRRARTESAAQAVAKLPGIPNGVFHTMPQPAAYQAFR
jgi:two-component system, chemotaxis family, sensor kinase Cph1